MLLIAVANARRQAEAEMETFREAMRLRAERRAKGRQAANEHETEGAAEQRPQNVAM